MNNLPTRSPSAELSEDARGNIAAFGRRLLGIAKLPSSSACPNCPAEEIPEERRAALWADHARASARQKMRARRRLIAVSVAVELIASGLERQFACTMVPAAIAAVIPDEYAGYSGPQIERFLDKIKGLDRIDWLPALLDLNWGRPPKEKNQ